MRKLYLGRRDALVERIRARLGDVLTIHCADAGLHLSAFLPAGVDDREVLRRGGGAGDHRDRALRVLRGAAGARAASCSASAGRTSAASSRRRTRSAT